MSCFALMIELCQKKKFSSKYFERIIRKVDAHGFISNEVVPELGRVSDISVHLYL